MMFLSVINRMPRCGTSCGLRGKYSDKSTMSWPTIPPSSLSRRWPGDIYRGNASTPQNSPNSGEDICLYLQVLGSMSKSDVYLTGRYTKRKHMLQQLSV